MSAAVAVCSLCGEPPHPAGALVCPRTGTPTMMTGPCGTTIDRYRVERWIGTGGMGAVYEAKHLHLGQPVAMKLLHAHLSTNASVVERFVREAQAAAAIGNRHIVRIFDFGVAPSGQPFFVMEMLEGADLESVVEAGAPFPVAWSVDIVLQILNGLGAAHAAGVVHRDLKPANVFLTGVPGTTSGSGDFVKIVDFGISKVVDETKPSITRTGAILGTPAYMAPEQARGMRDLDHRVDLYATSVILYELLSGKLPHDNETYEDLLVRVCTEPPRPLREVAPQLDEDLLGIVERGLAREPPQRFQSARELSEALLAVKIPEGDPSSIISLPGLTGAMRSYRALRSDPSMGRPQGPSYLPLGSVPAPEPGSVAPPATGPAQLSVLSGRGPAPASPRAAGVPFAETLPSTPPRSPISAVPLAPAVGAPATGDLRSPRASAAPASAAPPAPGPAARAPRPAGAGAGVWIALLFVSLVAVAATSALLAIGLSQLGSRDSGSGAGAPPAETDGVSLRPASGPTTRPAPAVAAQGSGAPAPRADPGGQIPGIVTPPNGIASLLPLLGLDPDEVATLPGPVQSAPPPTGGVGIGIPFSNSGVDPLSVSDALERSRPALLACRQRGRSITVRVAAVISEGRVENSAPAWDNTGDLGAVACVGNAFQRAATERPLRGSGIVQFEIALGPG